MYNLGLLLFLASLSTALSISLPSPAQPLNFSAVGNTASDIFPFRYDIPNSPFHLNIGFVSPIQRFDSQELRSFFLAAQAVASNGTRDHGSNEPLPGEPGVEDIFRYSLDDSIFVSIRDSHYALTWGGLEDVLRGLKEYLVNGKRPYWTRFEIVIGDLPVIGNGVLRGKGARVDET